MLLLFPEYLLASNAITALVAIIALVLLSRSRGKRAQRFPVVNKPMILDIFSLHPKWQFWTNARSAIRSGLKQADVFCLINGIGDQVVLAPKYASELASQPLLSFWAMLSEQFLSHIRGFDPFASLATWDVMNDALRRKLTKNLGIITKGLSEETTLALEDEWTDNPVSEWHTVPLKPTLVNIAARISARGLLGEELAHNKEWIRLSINYIKDCFIASMLLQQFPQWIRPFLADLLPPCRKLRRHLAQASALILPLLQERRCRATTEGQSTTPSITPNDSLAWMEEVAKGRRYSPVDGELLLAFAAVNTTTDTLSQVLLDICGHEGLVQALRDETLDVFRKNNVNRNDAPWHSAALLAKLHLMDSVLKESQRLKPVAVVQMNRVALEDIVLSDGTLLEKGTTLCVSNEKMWDANTYPNPNTFDPYRFLRMRRQSQSPKSAEFVSPSVEHMGFGFGNHACPGRFFAAAALKIALCHILLMYDFALATPAKPRVWEIGVSLVVSPRACITVRRRKAEEQEWEI
ncbi:cytochrome P450 [Aspergillus stella-maris]|uniref:cytochrome P450 n=1 Tax=Aspergillus stella-maris TaxID=1810926 RepID=UPI003CCDCE03